MPPASVWPWACQPQCRASAADGRRETGDPKQANNPLNVLIRPRPGSDGPQFVTRHGEEVAVVVSIAEYRHLRQGERDFKEFLQSAPDIDLDLSRSPLPARRVDLS